MTGKSYAHSSMSTALGAVRSRIAAAAHAAGRDPGSVRLIAVSKAFPVQAVCAAALCGQRAFGENYAQEAADKIVAVRAWSEGKGPKATAEAMSPSGDGFTSPAQQLPLELEWHFIGPIQSNKTKLLSEYFDWVQSVDRARIAQRLSDQRPVHLPSLQICIQVNVSGERSKSGVPPPELFDLAQEVATLPRLRLRGLMTIPEPSADASRLRQQFRLLRDLQSRLTARGFPLDTLSMGMSDDLELAIAEGASMVRVGRALFGERPVRDGMS